jgi:hypothetical protein
LWRLLKINAGWKVERWPCRVTGLRIDTVESVAGFPALTERLAWATGASGSLRACAAWAASTGPTPNPSRKDTTTRDRTVAAHGALPAAF